MGICLKFEKTVLKFKAISENFWVKHPIQHGLQKRIQNVNTNGPFVRAASFQNVPILCRDIELVVVNPITAKLIHLEDKAATKIMLSVTENETKQMLLILHRMRDRIQ